MRALFAPVAALLLTTAVLLFGQGLQGLLVPVEAAAHGYSPRAIGLMGSCYFAGFVAGSVLGPRLIGRVGHIRSFSVLASVAAATALLYPMFPAEGLWSLLRGVTGFCFAGLYMVVESWLNERADNGTRGRILATYTTVNLIAMMGGQLLLQLPDVTGFGRFAVVSVLVSLAGVPVALTKTLQPAPIATPKVDLKALYQLSPLALVAGGLIGLAGACFWTLGPVFAAGTGHGDAFIAHFMSAAVLGGALAQWPLGRLSDRIDRRKVILFAALGAALAGGALAIAGMAGAPPLALIALAFVQGATSLSIWSIVVAHANDTAQEGEFVRLSSSLLIVYGVGAALGPFLAALLDARFGFSAVYVATAMFHSLLVLFVLYRMTLREMAPRKKFVAVPRTSTSVFQLDPRAEGAGEDIVTEGAGVPPDPPPPPAGGADSARDAA